MKINDRSEFLKRRQLTQAKLTDKDILVCYSASPKIKNGDVHYPFKQNSNFFYLTGLPHSQGILVMTKKSETLYLKQRTKTQQQWMGKTIDVNDVSKVNWVSECLDSEKWNLNIFSGYERVYLPWRDEVESSENLIKELRDHAPRRNYPHSFLDLDQILMDLRAIKTTWEIEKLKISGQIAVKAHADLKLFVQSGARDERLLSHYIEQQFYFHGASDTAYGTIMAGGNRANTLHYEDNNQKIKNDELLLVDAGCNFEGYASDITRTYPVSGKWSLHQGMIADLVAEAQRECIKMIKPGVSWSELGEKAKFILASGLKKLGIFSGSPQKIMASSDFKIVYPHGLGHHLGLDVHDLGPYPKDKSDLLTVLKKGNVLTIEPGLYFDKNNKNIPKEFRGIGIRLEDDIVVTASSHANITAALPLL